MAKTAVVTGCNRGIGYELTKQLIGRGYSVVGVCRKPSKELEDLKLEKIIEGVDFSTAEGRKNAEAELKKVKIDLLVNNAGILRSMSLENFDEQATIDQFMVNALAPVELTIGLRHSLNPGAKVAMITSRMGSISDNDSGGSYGYRMSKAALNAASKSLALDLRAREVSVAILHPGWVKTEMTGKTGHLDAAESAKNLIDRIEGLSIGNTGTFWHCQGEVLPW